MAVQLTCVRCEAVVEDGSPASDGWCTDTETGKSTCGSLECQRESVSVAARTGQAPSVGRIVHYHSYGTPGGEFKPKPRAAIITEVHDVRRGDVDVCVLNPTGIFFNRVGFSMEPKPGCWNWPPRV